MSFHWVYLAVRMFLFVAVMLPGFIQCAFRYYFDDHVVHDVCYGSGPRQSLDIYFPKHLAGARRRLLQRTRRDADSGSEALSADNHPSAPLAPVVVFCCGGAWLIGYKAWAGELGRRLAAAGCIVVSVDYNNFPQASMDGMVKDVDLAVQFVLDNCRSWGGDRSQLTLMGQSAGAQLALVALLHRHIAAVSCSPSIRRRRLQQPQQQQQQQQQQQETPDDGSASEPWSAADIHAFVGISGPYNLVDARQLLKEHRLSDASLDQLFCVTNGQRDEVVSHNNNHWLLQYSPSHIVEQNQLLAPPFSLQARAELVARFAALPGLSPPPATDSDAAVDAIVASAVNPSFPPVFLYHGTGDRSALPGGALELHRCMESKGATVTTVMVEACSHTDLIIEDLLDGRDPLTAELVRIAKVDKSASSPDDPSADVLALPVSMGCVTLRTQKELARLHHGSTNNRLLSPALVSLGRFFNPF